MGGSDSGQSLTTALNLFRNPAQPPFEKDLSIAPLRRSLLIKTWLQRRMGWLFLLPFCGLLVLLLKFLGKYQIEDGEAWRKRFKALTQDKTPTLICSNHLTFID